MLILFSKSELEAVLVKMPKWKRQAIMKTLIKVKMASIKLTKLAKMVPVKTVRHSPQKKKSKIIMFSQRNLKCPLNVIQSILGTSNGPLSASEMSLWRTKNNVPRLIKTKLVNYWRTGIPLNIIKAPKDNAKNMDLSRVRAAFLKRVPSLERSTSSSNPSELSSMILNIDLSTLIKPGCPYRIGGILQISELRMNKSWDLSRLWNLRRLALLRKSIWMEFCLQSWIISIWFITWIWQTLLLLETTCSKLTLHPLSEKLLSLRQTIRITTMYHWTRIIDGSTRGTLPLHAQRVQIMDGTGAQQWRLWVFLELLNWWLTTLLWCIR